METEWKIGEIRQIDGEWYQCIEGGQQCCSDCAFYQLYDFCHSMLCSLVGRADRTHVIFKKLEMVGTPYTAFADKIVQNYLLETDVSVPPKGVLTLINNEQRLIAIEIKQNNLVTGNLKPFDFQKAKDGKPVCTRDGRKVRIICFDRKGGSPVIALVETFVKEYDCIREDSFYYTVEGRAVGQNTESKDDLMMSPEKKEGWLNVYKELDGVTFSKHPYNSKEEAIKAAGVLSERIDTVKVSWEE